MNVGHPAGEQEVIAAIARPHLNSQQKTQEQERASSCLQDLPPKQSSLKSPDPRRVLEERNLPQGVGALLHSNSNCEDQWSQAEAQQ